MHRGSGPVRAAGAIRYLGIEVDDALALSEHVEPWGEQAGSAPLTANCCPRNSTRCRLAIDQRPVCLHHSENESRADPEEQHSVGRLERAHHSPAPLQH
jgi:hypothetical protein